MVQTPTRAELLWTFATSIKNYLKRAFLLHCLAGCLCIDLAEVDPMPEVAGIEVLLPSGQRPGGAAHSCGMPGFSAFEKMRASLPWTHTGIHTYIHAHTYIYIYLFNYIFFSIIYIHTYIHAMKKQMNKCIYILYYYMLFIFIYIYI